MQRLRDQAGGLPEAAGKDPSAAEHLNPTPAASPDDTGAAEQAHVELGSSRLGRRQVDHDFRPVLTDANPDGDAALDIFRHAGSRDDLLAAAQLEQRLEISGVAGRDVQHVELTAP